MSAAQKYGRPMESLSSETLSQVKQAGQALADKGVTHSQSKASEPGPHWSIKYAGNDAQPRQIPPPRGRAEKENTMNNNGKNQKYLWAAGAVLVFLYFAPAALNPSGRRRLTGSRWKRSKRGRRRERERCKPLLPAAPAASPSPTPLSNLTGMWQGQQGAIEPRSLPDCAGDARQRRGRAYRGIRASVAWR